MSLDIRLPIGMLFSCLGTLLLLYGLWSDKAIYARSLGINVNVWWGIVMGVFGAVMIWLARRSVGAPTTAPPVERAGH